MSVKMRKIVEKEIVTAVIAALLKAGYAISVNNGEEMVLLNSKKKSTILAAMFTTDQDTLNANDKDGSIVGWVDFIYGNGGYDVIHDYTTNLESLIGDGTPVQSVIDKYAD